MPENSRYVGRSIMWEAAARGCRGSHTRIASAAFPKSISTRPENVSNLKCEMPGIGVINYR